MKNARPGNTVAPGTAAHLQAVFTPLCSVDGTLGLTVSATMQLTRLWVIKTPLSYEKIGGSMRRD